MYNNITIVFIHFNLQVLIYFKLIKKVSSNTEYVHKGHQCLKVLLNYQRVQLVLVSTDTLTFNNSLNAVLQAFPLCYVWNNETL